MDKGETTTDPCTVKMLVSSIRRAGGQLAVNVLVKVHKTLHNVNILVKVSTVKGKDLLPIYSKIATRL